MTRRNSSIRPALLRWLTFLLILVGAQLAQAELTLPAVLADHMVVQRDRAVHLWGWDTPGQAVSASFRGASAKTQADDYGRWEIFLPPGDAGGPFPMEVHGSSSIQFSDVLVGDVWLASGQSNMEFTTGHAAHAADELKSADRPRIRLFHVEKASAGFAKDDLKARPWIVVSSDSVKDFSAVGYFFAREVQDHLPRLKNRQAVPIGMIEADWGGTPAEAWTSLKALSGDAGLMPVLSSYSEMTEGEANKLREDQWRKQVTAKALAEGKPAPQFQWHPDFQSWQPGGLYNAMIAPLTSFPVRGFIWYQGESNTGGDRAPYYAALFQTMIRDWRSRWREGDLPFLFVQLANYKSGPGSQWPMVRDAQRQTLSLRNTGMAVAIDVGNPDDIHPTNKQDVGKRLALAARAIAYGEPIEYSGPLFREAVPYGERITVTFDHATGGLVAKGSAVRGFEIAGQDRHFEPAIARIEGPTVVLTSASVARPLFVRYGSSGSPDCTLYNSAGLPAATFEDQK